MDSTMIRERLGLPPAAIIERAAYDRIGTVYGLAIGPDAVEGMFNPSRTLEFCLEADGETVLVAPRGHACRLPFPVFRLIALTLYGLSIRQKDGLLGPFEMQRVLLHASADGAVAGTPAPLTWEVAVLGVHRPPMRTGDPDPPRTIDGGLVFCVHAQAGLSDLRSVPDADGFAWSRGTYIPNAVCPDRGDAYRLEAPDGGFYAFRLPPRSRRKSADRSAPAYLEGTCRHGFALVVPAVSPPLKNGRPLCPDGLCGGVAL